MNSMPRKASVMIYEYDKVERDEMELLLEFITLLTRYFHYVVVVAKVMFSLKVLSCSAPHLSISRFVFHLNISVRNNARLNENLPYVTSSEYNRRQ